MTELIFKINEFDQAKDQALMEWLRPRWDAERGGGLRATIGKSSVELGRAGEFKWKTYGLAVGLWAGSCLAVQLASEGSARMPAWLFFAVLPVYASLAPAAEGGGDYWRRARESGAGPLRSFGGLCARYALKVAGLSAPQFIAQIPQIPVLIAKIGIATAQNALSFMGAPKASAALNPAMAKMTQAQSHLSNADHAIKLWKAGLLVKVARMDGASDFQAENIYAELAKLRMGARWQRFYLAQTACELDPALAARFEPVWALHQAELALRESTAKLIEQRALDKDSLRLLLDTIEASGAPAWFTPRPGMPTLAEMAVSVEGHYAYAHGGGLKERVAALSAEQEARAIQSAVGPLMGAPTISSPSKKTRL